jgi:hypothetical protein
LRINWYLMGREAGYTFKGPKKVIRAETGLSRYLSERQCCVRMAIDRPDRAGHA